MGQREFTWPVAASATVTTGSIEFKKNSADTPVSQDTTTPANSVPLPVALLNTSGAAFDPATSAKQDAEAVLVGAVNETAPSTDTASSGLNGRLQRIAQRITSLIALLPGSLGQKASTASFAVVIASDQSAIPASQSGTWATRLNDGAGTSVTVGQKAMASSLPVVLSSDQSAVPVSQSGTWNVGQSGAWNVGQTGTWIVQPGNTANTTAWLVTQAKAASSAVTSVAGATSSTSLLASNTSRKGATFFNDSTATLYLKLGATASTSSYTVQVPAQGYFELPFTNVYTGAIDGIWSSANGNVRITELT